MLEWGYQRLERPEEGFTLIELMVVVLIIAILIAIAIPTFLGARKRAQDRQAQANIRNALLAEKTVYTDQQAYTATAATLAGIESSLTFNSAPTTADASARTVGVTLPVSSNTDIVCIGSKSKSGAVFLISDVATAATATDAGTYYNTGATPATGCPTALTDLTATGASAGWSKTSW
jgi:type IV pilus assembly protein PilA